MNISNLFEQFIVSGNGSPMATGYHPKPDGRTADEISVLQQFASRKAGGFAGGLAAGGLLGALIGNKKMRKGARKLAGGALGYGGSAVLGALALKALQNWQSQKSEPAQKPVQGVATHAISHVPAISAPELFDPASNDDATGQPMQLALIKAMIAAANADGHIDQQEQAKVFDAVEKMAPDAESKAVVLDILRNPPSIAEISAYPNGLEQASEIYLVSRLAIDPDHPAERRYLGDLAKAMALPGGLIDEIESQFASEPAPEQRNRATRFGRNGHRRVEAGLHQ